MHTHTCTHTEYPESPSNVKCQRSSAPPCLVVQWTPSKPLPEGNSIDGYAVHLNSNACVRLGPSPKPVKSVSAQIFVNDLREFRDVLLQANIIALTVCAVSGDYYSAPSLPVVVPKDDVRFVCSGGKMTADESEITSSATSLSSIEDDEVKEVYNPAITAQGLNGSEGTEGTEQGGVASPERAVGDEEDVNMSNGVGESPAGGSPAGTPPNVTPEEHTGKTSPSHCMTYTYVIIEQRLHTF